MGKPKNKINLQEATLRTYNNYTIFFVTNMISLLLVLITPVYRWGGGGGVKPFRRRKAGGVSEVRLCPTRWRGGQKVLVFCTS